MKKKNGLSLIIPVIISAVIALALFFGVFRELDFYVYDNFLHVRKGLEEDPSILFLEIDDTSIDYVGVWPWSRDVMADGLFLLKEFDADRAVFDIEYIQTSPRGINQDVLTHRVPDTLDRRFTDINANIRDLFNAVQQGYIPLEDAADYVGQLEDLNFSIQDSLIEDIRRIARDNDRYLGDAAAFFGDAFFTVTMVPEEYGAEESEYLDWVTEEFGYDNISGHLGIFPPSRGIVPAIPPVLENAEGAGFPNIIIDSDGVRRRIQLFRRYGDTVFPQLVMAPLLDRMGNPRIVVENRMLYIEPTGGEDAIAIPLNSDGTVLLNWPAGNYSESFRHLSWFYLILHQRQEEELLENLRIMEEGEYLSYYTGQDQPLELYSYIEGYKNDILAGQREYSPEYAQMRQYFFDTVGDFLNGETRETILEIIDDILDSPEFSEEEKSEYTEIKAEVETNFETLLGLYNDIVDTRAIIREEVPGSFIIIGANATSTTDWGVNPFEENFPNMGTHGALLNMIQQRAFLTELSSWYGFAAGILFLFILVFALPRLNPGAAVAAGLGCVLLYSGAALGIFLLYSIHIPAVGGFLTVLLGFISLFILKLLSTSREKAYIHNAFNHYLSSDVINEILQDPAKLSLGGDKKHITAMFTDVRGFSSISEKMDPSDLVSLLNRYLSRMSDMIIGVQGTIDKYEGDAIISFFGAPLDMSDHASRACKAAIQMAKVEKELNEEFIRDGLLSTPLFTRVGINTGDMVVGNMGTRTRMDYTIMGHSVNLAARLEGVNKQYDSRILISEMTRAEIGDRFTLRKLDKVRVVGISEPVRLYELLNEYEDAKEYLLDGLDKFHEGLVLFEQKKWKKAGECFAKSLELISDDGPSAVYLRRCREYSKNPPPESWDGVFNLSSK